MDGMARKLARSSSYPAWMSRPPSAGAVFARTAMAAECSEANPAKGEYDRMSASAAR
ncbi:hypothetical protein [Streptomyces sp. 1331.2]|uniref:hypothetical protein n=1 Tax=Streptomyces sp. 1331.2 TaxID=1938835 RepID=UPI000BCDC01E|nr:hypothetical protein [Streptomyces sp. 1331.2]SOB80721.1 hypothetical protein SAMN06272789_1088 [Streptomyces sp. 1331.2]